VPALYWIESTRALRAAAESCALSAPLIPRAPGSREAPRMLSFCRRVSESLAAVLGGWVFAHAVRAMQRRTV
jgi:hypothetical protein